jgi:hypothetical protein
MSGCSCSEKCQTGNGIVNNLQNGSVDLFNRTSYLTTPYAVGPSLSTITPSNALSVAPVQGCGAYSFVSPTLGLGAPAPASSIGIPITAPQLGFSTMFSNNQQYVPGLSTTTVSSSQQCVPNNSGQIVSPVVTTSFPQMGVTLQANPNVPASNMMTSVVGLPPSVTVSSSKNLMRATGQTTTTTTTTNDVCQDQSFSSPVTEVVNNCGVGAFGTGVFGTSASFPVPIVGAPSIAVGGINGLAVAPPANLSGMPNLNLTSGIAFQNECGPNYGLKAPIAVQGPIAPPINVLGSNYLQNFSSQPYYSGLNSSEPAAIMNSANPLYPGYAMLARDWKGTPQIIVSKPDKYGCPQFETISAFDDHGEDCDCGKCTQYCIDNCEYICINGFGDAVPSSNLAATLIVSPLGTVATKVVDDNEFYFVVQPANLASASSPLLCKAEDAGYNYAIAVNGVPLRNILMFKGCTYTIKFGLDEAALKDFSANIITEAKKLRLVFTRDPAGCTGCIGGIGGTPDPCCASLVDPNFTPGFLGLAVGQKINYTPTKDAHPDCLTTIYYQLTCAPFAGGPITIL